MLKCRLKKTCDDHNPIIITHQREASVVILSLEDYQALEETSYLLRSSKFNIAYREIVNHLEGMFDNVEITIDGEFFKRLFINQDGVSLKLEFIYENVKTVGLKTQFKNVQIDAKENICANKIGTVMDRRAVKDFVDLYYLLEEIHLADAVAWSEYKKVPPDYEGLMMGIGDLIAHPQRLEGYALLCRSINQEKFQQFIKNLLETLVTHAKSR